MVLPAPGGATSTAALRPASVRASSSSTASIGKGVSKERGKSVAQVRFISPSYAGLDPGTIFVAKATWIVPDKPGDDREESDFTSAARPRVRRFHR